MMKATLFGSTLVNHYARPKSLDSLAAELAEHVQACKRITRLIAEQLDDADDFDDPDWPDSFGVPSRR